MKPYKTLTVGAFEEAYLKRNIVSIEIIGGCIHFSWSCGNKGQIYMANGNPKIWKSDEKAKDYIDRLDVSIEFSDRDKKRKEKILKDAHDVISEMIVDETGDYIVLALPNGEYGAFYGDLLDKDLFKIARGQLKDSLTVTGTIESVASSIKEHVEEIYSCAPGGFEKHFLDGSAMNLTGIIADALRRISAQTNTKNIAVNEKMIVFNNAHEALRAAQELLEGSNKAISEGRGDNANIRIMIPGE